MVDILSYLNHIKKLKHKCEKIYGKPEENNENYTDYQPIINEDMKIIPYKKINGKKPWNISFNIKPIIRLLHHKPVMPELLRFKFDINIDLMVIPHIENRIDISVNDLSIETPFAGDSLGYILTPCQFDISIRKYYKLYIIIINIYFMNKYRDIDINSSQISMVVTPKTIELLKFISETNLKMEKRGKKDKGKEKKKKHKSKSNNSKLESIYICFYFIFHVIELSKSTDFNIKFSSNVISLQISSETADSLYEPIIKCALYDFLVECENRKISGMKIKCNMNNGIQYYDKTYKYFTPLVDTVNSIYI